MNDEGKEDAVKKNMNVEKVKMTEENMTEGEEKEKRRQRSEELNTRQKGIRKTIQHCRSNTKIASGKGFNASPTASASDFCSFYNTRQ